MYDLLDKLFLQKNYAENMGLRLDKFSIQSHSPFKANFRCPICGDSAKNKSKKRAYFLEKNGTLQFYCHNECGSINFERFMKLYHPDLYSMYRFDLMIDAKNQKTVVKPATEKEEQKVPNTTANYLNGLINFQQDLRCLQYIKNRKIPSMFYQDIWYTDKFYQYVNSIIPNKFNENYNNINECRVVFPMRYFDGNIFGIIGRSLQNNHISKYITIKFDDKPKFFGLDRLDKNKLAYVTEGPIDSFFIENCIALAGTDGDVSTIFDSLENFVMILDNQPRSKSVIKKYKKYIDKGFNILIWPNNVNIKDINDWVLSGQTYNSLMDVIKNNTFRGIRAEIEFNRWRKI